MDDEIEPQTPRREDGASSADEGGPGATSPPLLEVPTDDGDFSDEEAATHDGVEPDREDELSSVEGLINPEQGVNSPASDADAQLPG